MQDLFHPAVERWFREEIGKPSEPQLLGWPEIAAGRNVLICAPTGSGKTLAAFLKCIDMLYSTKQPGVKNTGIKTIYISPLKALNNDIYRNLELPLSGIARTAASMGIELPEVTAAVRTGDTPQKERSRMLRNPPDILITTPESLFIMLTSENSRKLFTAVDNVIIDEVHSLCPNKRGVHLALSVERLERLCGKPLQRIGLSATISPVEEAAAYLGGCAKAESPRQPEEPVFVPRPVTIINCDRKRRLELKVSIPVKDLRSLPDGSIWPKIYHQLLTLVRAHKSTLIFVNNRRLAEQVASGMNSLAEESFVKVHHGSISKEIRQELEKELKEEKLQCLVATSTLELGIDIGNIELVIQVGSPGSVAQTLQRIGRAGHRLEGVSKGFIIPKTRGDLLEAAFNAYRTLLYDMDNTKVPVNCLDILAQQLVSIACEGSSGIRELFELVRGAYSYRDLGFERFEAVAAMLGNPSPSEEPGLLKPRLYYDKLQGRISGSSAGRVMCLNCGGTIPDRGYYPVYIKNSDVRLGELEEEFVFESRIGERFLLGSSTWKLERIENDRVYVCQSNDPGAKLPFWKGDDVLRPYETGLKYGRFLSLLQQKLDDGSLLSWVGENCGFDEASAENLLEYVRDQAAETGMLHGDKRIVCEYFSDETGDRRLIIHSPFGGSIHAALAMVLHLRLSKLLDCDIEYVYSDNGILLHFLGYTGNLSNVLSLLKPEKLEDEIIGLLPSAPMFNLNMRYNLARSLLINNRGFGKRKPLWIQRLRSAELIDSLSKITDHPVFLETFRECLNDMMDLANLQKVLKDIRNGRIQVAEVVTQKPSPFSSELLFSFWQSYQYTEDLPVAERRNQLLISDRSFIRAAAGVNAEYELLDPRAAADVGRELQQGRYGMKIGSAEELYYYLNTFGELEASAGGDCALKEPSAGMLCSLLAELEKKGSIIKMPLNASGTDYWVTVEDYPLFKAVLNINWDSAGNAEHLAAALRILRRFIRFSLPFGISHLEERYSLNRELILEALEVLENKGEILRIREDECVDKTVFCHKKVYDRIRKRTVALARQEIKPREERIYCAFLMEYQGIGTEDVLPSEEKLAKVLGQLQGLFLPAAWWEDFILPARVRNYDPKLLDYLCSTGVVRWVARMNKNTGEVAFLTDDSEALPLGLNREYPDAGTFEREAYDILQNGGACFLKDFSQKTGIPPVELLNGVEGLVWKGLITNDSFSVIRYYIDNEKKNSPWLRYGTYPSMGRWYCAGQEPSEYRDSGEEGLARCITQLLDRYGILSKETAVCENGVFRWSEMYRFLKANEFSSGIKRGLYVAGLSGLQYTRDRELELMRMKEDNGRDSYQVLCSCDPANPYKDIFSKSSKYKTGRNHGTAVVFKNGTPIMLVKEFGGWLVPLDEAEGSEAEAAAAFIDAFRLKKLWASRKNVFTEFWGNDKRPIDELPVCKALLELGYTREYRGVTLWRSMV